MLTLCRDLLQELVVLLQHLVASPVLPLPDLVEVSNLKSLLKTLIDTKLGGPPPPGFPPFAGGQFPPGPPPPGFAPPRR